MKKTESKTERKKGSWKKERQKERWTASFSWNQGTSRLKRLGNGRNTVSRALFQRRELWAVIWGGAKRMGGGKRTIERALPKIFGPLQKASGLLCRGFLHRKTIALTLEGGGKRTVRGRVRNPFLGGVSFVRFSSPLFFHPPWRPRRTHWVLRPTRWVLRKTRWVGFGTQTNSRLRGAHWVLSVERSEGQNTHWARSSYFGSSQTWLF